MNLLSIFIVIASLLLVSGAQAAKFQYSQGTDVNLRSRPNLNSSIRCKLQINDRVIVLRYGRRFNYVRVKDRMTRQCNHKKGWVSKRYLGTRINRLPRSAQRKTAKQPQNDIGAAEPDNENSSSKRTSAIRSYYSRRTLLLSNKKSDINRINRWQKNGVAYDYFKNVPAYSNRRNGRYQCTELVHRFFREVYRVPTRLGIGMGHASRLTQNIKRRFGGRLYEINNNRYRMALLKNGRAQEPPAPGAAINFKIGKFGHIAIVRYVKPISKSKVRVYLIEQHGFFFTNRKPGTRKPIRSLLMTRSRSGTWSGGYTSGIGRPLYWLNFRRVK